MMTAETAATRTAADRSVSDLIRRQASSQPQAPAILAPGCTPLTYERLQRQLLETAQALKARDIGTQDRLALVVRNGPVLAVAQLAIMGSAIGVPLNPGYRATELEPLFQDLRTTTLVVEAGLDSPARSVAEAAGMAIIELTPTPDDAAGTFVLGAPSSELPDGGTWTTSQDIALLLHTSGTTSRPKTVPLTHANLCSSAHNIVTSLGLQPTDCCLSVLPLFHIHGIVGALLTSLTAGGSVVCVPSFDARQFSRLLEEFAPTWYTAVPSMHQMIMDQWVHAGEPLSRHRLRFIRSCSSSLAPSLLAALESRFGVPVVEAYGMTEASHQIAINPLPPAQRKPGSVGRPSGSAIAILADSGDPLPPGAPGEIVVRGPSIMAGYENLTGAAASAAFHDGWFRTGDEGYIDEDGYVFITGRLKELINRGGVKIAPREIDEVLLQHPVIAAALAFAFPHPTLGEEIAAAVVFHPDMTATELAIQRFAAHYLADYKVPRRIVVVPALPTGPTGKFQRVGLAERLGVKASDGSAAAGQAAHVAPRTELETALADLWCEVLELDSVSIRDDFFELGGDSLGAAILCAGIESRLAKHLPPAALFDATTIEQLADLIDSGEADGWKSLVPMRPQGSKPPFFCVHGILGDVLCFSDLARNLGPEQPFYALQAPSFADHQELYASIPTLARCYLDEIRTVQPSGPYYLGGFSSGGGIALEMAHQLISAGECVALLAILDWAPVEAGYDRLGLTPRTIVGLLRDVAANVPEWTRAIARRTPRQQLALVRQQLPYVKQAWNKLARQEVADSARAHIDECIRHVELTAGAEFASHLQDRRQSAEAQRQALLHYRAPAYPGRIALFRARTQPILCTHDWAMGWTSLAQGGLDIRVIPGDHDRMLLGPNAAVLARQLAADLACAAAAASAASRPTRPGAGG